MDWLIVLIAIGALLPILVAVATVLLFIPKGHPGSWRLAIAFGKGIALGVAMGATVSALVIGLVLGGAWALRR